MTLDEAEREDERPDDTNWFGEKYDWLVWVDALADGKRKDWDYFLAIPVAEFLHAVVFLHDKTQHQREQQKKIDKMVNR